MAIVLIIVITITTSTMVTPVKEEMENVWVVTEGRAELPCKSNPKVEHDQATIVLWYLSSSSKPIYSYDARDGNFTTGVRWYDEKIVGRRASFYVTSRPPIMVLDPVLASDQGAYMCRVDYRISPPTVSTVNLTVVIPPGPPLVFLDEDLVVGTVGPIRENERIELTCRSVGGRPAPTITWWSNDKSLPILTSIAVPDYVTGTTAVSATLYIVGKRELQETPLTCRVDTPTSGHLQDSPFLHPKTVSVALIVTLPPVEVRILGSKTVSATSGSRISLVCQAYGSHPSAHLTWWNEETSLETFFTQATEDRGNVTSSRLSMTVERQDDGRTLSCQAVNPAVPEKTLRDTVNLVVYYSPAVRLSLGRALDPESIKDGDDVYFECHVKANPQHHRIQWFRNDVELSQNRSAGIMMSGLSLVLPGLQRRHSGAFRCSATNLQGTTASNVVNLTVKHSPVCVEEDTERTQGALRGATTKVRCRVEAEPSDGITWMWMRMKADGTEEIIESNLIHSKGLFSSVQVTPLGQEDYGHLICRATNEVGMQQVPCVISLMPVGPPEVPTNCTASPGVTDHNNDLASPGVTDHNNHLASPGVTDHNNHLASPGVADHNNHLAFPGVTDHNSIERRWRVGKEKLSKSEETEEISPVTKGVQERSSIIVRCLEGFDGGLEQYFLLEAWQGGRLLANKSSRISEWTLNGVRMGVNVNVNIAAHNARGRSEYVALEITTRSAQQHVAPDSEGIIDWASLLGAVIGAVGVIVLLLLMCIIIVRRKLQRSLKPESDLQGSSAISEGFNPDVVQSIQRQPPGLDVLPCLQEECEPTGSTSVCSSSSITCIQKYSGVGLSKDHQVGGQLYDKIEEKQSQFTGHSSTQKSAKKKRNRKENQGLHHATSTGDDSALTESESDSDVRDLMSRSEKTKNMGKNYCEKSPLHLSVDDRMPPHFSAPVDQLTEPSSLSGDSGIQSMSSTKPLLLSLEPDEKTTSLSTDYTSQIKAIEKQSIPLQGPGEHQLSPLSGEFRFSDSRERSRIQAFIEPLSKTKVPWRHSYSWEHQMRSEGSRFSDPDWESRLSNSRELFYQTRTTRGSLLYPQSTGNQQVSPLSERNEGETFLSVLQPQATSCATANQPSLSYSKDLLTADPQFSHRKSVTYPHFANPSPFPTSQKLEKENKTDWGKPLGLGRPATLLKSNREDVLLFSKTLPGSFSQRNRRKSASGLTVDRTYCPSSELYASSSELECIAYSTSGIRALEKDLSRDRKTGDSQSTNNVKQQLVDAQSQREAKDIRGDVVEKENNLPFQFNYSERESSV